MNCSHGELLSYAVTIFNDPSSTTDPNLFAVNARYGVQIQQGGFFSVVANVQDGDIVVKEFKLHLRYYVQFWTNTVEKGMDILILLVMY